MDELTKSIDALAEEFFAEPVTKAAENFEVARASKTTADAVMAEVPGSEDDAARGAGRPKDDHDVPKTDTDGNPAKGYDAVQKDQAEEQNPEAAKQAPSVSQVSDKGHMSQGSKSSHDARGPMFKSDAEYTEYQELKKAKAAADAQKAQEDLKKAEDLKKVEQENLIKSAIEKALAPQREENQKLRKALEEQGALVKAMASQPRQAKSVTSIEALEKSQTDKVSQEGQTFSKAEILDVAEELFKAGKIPMDAVIEIDNTGTVLNPGHRAMIEKKLVG
jgi:hypothetical protein